MMLLTKEIRRCFEKQGDTSAMDMSQIKIVCKLFNPCGAQTWYLYEHVEDDIYMAFANLGDPFYAECGTVSLNELMSVRLPAGLTIERDRSFKPMSMTLQEVFDKIKAGGHV